MAGSVNKVILVGNVGRDPEVKASKAGDPFATFSLATTYSYRPQGGDRVDQTEWHRIVAWRTLADQTAKYVTKGRKVYVEGRIQSRQYTDQNGEEKSITEIVASAIEFLDSMKDRAETNGGTSGPAPATLAAPQKRAPARDTEDFDDIPF
jgi:single-strand DNA-binding protein